MIGAINFRHLSAFDFEHFRAHAASSPMSVLSLFARGQPRHAA
jgi:hypothetical protein